MREQKSLNAFQMTVTCFLPEHMTFLQQMREKQVDKLMVQTVSDCKNEELVFEIAELVQEGMRGLKSLHLTLSKEDQVHFLSALVEAEKRQPGFLSELHQFCIDYPILKLDFVYSRLNSLLLLCSHKLKRLVFSGLNFSKLVRYLGEEFGEEGVIRLEKLYFGDCSIKTVEEV